MNAPSFTAFYTRRRLIPFSAVRASLCANGPADGPHRDAGLQGAENRLIIGLFCLALVLGLGACTRGTTSALIPTATGSSAVTAGPASPTATTVTIAATPAGLTAEIAELVKTVRAKVSPDADFVDAFIGQEVPAGGQVETGEQSRAKIDLSDGTIVRLDEETIFTVVALEPEPDNPITRMKLLAGRVWVILAGGVLQVETPVGIATVRGSYLSISYDPVTQTAILTCLEGSCTIESGGVLIPLTTGEQAQVIGANNPPTAVGRISQEEVNAWLANNPEATVVMPTLTSLPTVTPTASETPVPSNTPSPTATTPPPTGTPTDTPTPPITDTPTATPCPEGMFFDPYQNGCRFPDPTITNTPKPPPPPTPYGGGFTLPDGRGEGSAARWRIGLGFAALGALVTINLLSLWLGRRRSRSDAHASAD